MGLSSHAMKILLAAYLLLPFLLQAELTHRTVTDIDSPLALTDFNQTYGLDSALVGDGRGNFYGVASRYGANKKGFIFRVTSGGQKSVLHTFAGGDGEMPLTALCLGKDGAFYGTTSAGGANGLGTVFRITSDGTHTLLHDFVGNEGTAARGRLLLAKDGHFYGTTSAGGDSGQGTVYRWSSTGQFAVLHHFNSTTGHEPYAGVTEGPDGALYGTGRRGGTYGYGVVFRITTAGDYRVLRNFGLPLKAPASQIGKVEGAIPRGELLHVGGGVFYATCSSLISYARGSGVNQDKAVLFVPTNINSGGPGKGTIYRISTKGSYATLYGFAASNAGPLGGLNRGADGAFYGTTLSGGTSGMGTIFRYVSGKTPTTAFTFTGPNGASPQGALYRDDAGNLWGIANSAPVAGQPDPAIIGSVFVLTAGRSGAKGSYIARVSDAGETHAGSGLVEVTLGATSAFTGRVTFAGTTYRLSGKFDALGDVTLTVGRGIFLPPLVLALHLNIAAPVVDRITGTLTTGALVLAVNVPRSPAFPLGPPLEIGSYTASLAPPVSGAVPDGTGHAIFSLGKTGAIKLTGMLPDLTKLSATTRLQSDGTCPLYVGLYAKNARGSLRGDATFADLASTDATANLRWEKPPQTKGIAATGLSTTLPFAASRYIAPPRFTRLLAVGDTLPNTRLLITEGVLVATHPFSLLLNNTDQFPPTDPSKPALSFKPKTGQWKGTFLQAGKKRSLTGVVLQKTVTGVGLYSDGLSTQAVALEAMP